MISLEMSPDTVTIDVEDDRPGISDARKDTMLEPFVRGDDARNMIARPSCWRTTASCRSMIGSLVD
jgi:hypothetical protein